MCFFPDLLACCCTNMAVTAFHLALGPVYLALSSPYLVLLSQILPRAYFHGTRLSRSLLLYPIEALLDSSLQTFRD